MTAESSPASIQDPTGWAAEQLGLGPRASTSEVRAAFLRRLPDVDFLPPEAWQRAYQQLTASGPFAPDSATGSPRLLQVEEDRLRREVENFASQFFRLPATNRKLRWQDLRKRCGSAPYLVARLRRLEPGLGLPEPVALLAAEEDPHVRNLAARLCQLFACRPTEGIVRREELLREMGQDPLSAADAAERLQKHYIGIAGLDSALVNHLISWRHAGEAEPDKHVVAPSSETVDKIFKTFLQVAVVTAVLILAGAMLRRFLDIMRDSNRNVPTSPPVKQPIAPAK
jgi:hypothetical protein